MTAWQFRIVAFNGTEYGNLLDAHALWVNFLSAVRGTSWV